VLHSGSARNYQDQVEKKYARANGPAYSAETTPVKRRKKSFIKLGLGFKKRFIHFFPTTSETLVNNKFLRYLNIPASI
jgi:hypothetical protein